MLKPLTKYDYRQLLADALRSGKYKQVVGGPNAWSYVRHEACALGVGVMIGLFSELTYGQDALEKLGIAPGDIYILNDNNHMSFPEIANWMLSQP